MKGRPSWIGMITCETKRPIIASLPKQPKIRSSSEHYELEAVCEEVANHIEDRVTGG